MQVSVAGLRRNIKNIAHNYTDPQKKVREATSNDPWGPSSTLMSEIADLTYNIEAFAQIMEMLWKRLNDHGKNWRHVYKSLVLLEYLIKTGSERVAQQCKENIFAIQTLKDFQYFEEGKDQGMNVREKAKQLVTLLTSDERLRNERARALKARERFAQTVSGFGSSDSNDTTPTSPVLNSAFGHGNNELSNGLSRSKVNADLEQARPQTIGEEELQLQLALAMSKEEADEEEKRRRSDELKLQMALSQSEQEFHQVDSPPLKNSASALVDLLDVDLGGAAGLAAQAEIGKHVRSDPWTSNAGIGSSSGNVDPWSTSSSIMISPQDSWKTSGSAVVGDPWASSDTKAQTMKDPWSANKVAVAEDEFDFDMISKRSDMPNLSAFNLDPLAPALTPMNLHNSNTESSPDGLNKLKDPLQFLGENRNLVNLDNLVPLKPATNIKMSPIEQQNPFSSPVGTSMLTSGGSNQTVNPFHIQNSTAKPSINEIREKQQQVNVGDTFLPGLSKEAYNPTLPSTYSKPTSAANNPWSPIKTENPFMN